MCTVISTDEYALHMQCCHMAVGFDSGQGHKVASFRGSRVSANAQCSKLGTGALLETLYKADPDAQCFVQVPFIPRS